MRLFIALPLPEAVREAVVERAARLRSVLPPARWVPPSNLHLTLRFLGEIEPARLADLHLSLAGCFGAHRPFRLRLTRGGCFPPRRPARVAWVGFAPCAELMDLQVTVAAGLRDRLGIGPEPRAFDPHLTLARPRRPWPRAAVDRWREAFCDDQGPSLEVASGQLMRSHLEPGVARHECLRAYPLGGARGAV